MRPPSLPSTVIRRLLKSHSYAFTSSHGSDSRQEDRGHIPQRVCLNDKPSGARRLSKFKT